MGMQVDDQLWYNKTTTSTVHIFIATIDVVPQNNKTVLFVQNVWRIACLGTKIFPEDLTMFPDASNDKAPE